MLKTSPQRKLQVSWKLKSEAQIQASVRRLTRSRRILGKLFSSPSECYSTKVQTAIMSQRLTTGNTSTSSSFSILLQPLKHPNRTPSHPQRIPEPETLAPGQLGSLTQALRSLCSLLLCQLWASGPAFHLFQLEPLWS